MLGLESWQLSPRFIPGFVWPSKSTLKWQAWLFSSRCFFSRFHPDELSETAPAATEWHLVQADVRGAGEQHPTGHHERDICLWGSEEERGLQQIAGAGAPGRELHEFRLQERADVRLQHRLPLQGNAVSSNRSVSASGIRVGKVAIQRCPWANPVCCYRLFSLSVLFLRVCSHKKHTDSRSESASLLFPFVFSHLSSLHLSAEKDLHKHTGALGGLETFPYRLFQKVMLLLMSLLKENQYPAYPVAHRRFCIINSWGYYEKSAFICE